MKHNRWLIYLVGFLLVINLSVYFAFKYLRAENYFKNRISSILEGAFNAKVQLEEFNITEKQIFISNIKLISKNNDYSIKAEQIYIDYNILSILLSQFFKAKMLEEIRIYNPEIYYHYSYDKKSKKHKTKTLVVEKLFKSVKIENARLKLSFSQDKNSFETQLDSLDINIDQSKNINFTVQSRAKCITKVKIKGILNNNSISEIESDIQQLLINQLNIDQYAKLNPQLNIYFKYKDQKLLYDIQIPDGELETQKPISQYLQSPETTYHNFRFYGNENNGYFQVNLINSSFDELRLKGKIKSPLKNAELIGDLFINNLKLPESLPVNGRIILNSQFSVSNRVKFNALISAPRLNVKINNIDSLLYPKEVKNITLQIKSDDIFNKNIIFKSNSFNILNGTSSIEGSYNVDKKSLESRLTGNRINYEYNDLHLFADMITTINYKKKQIEIESELNNLTAQYRDYYQKPLKAKISFKQNELNVFMLNEEESVQVAFKHNQMNQSQRLQIKLKQFALQELNHQLEINPITAEITAENDPQQLSIDSKGKFHQYEKELFNGRFESNLSIDKTKDISNFRFNLFNAYLNSQSITLNLLAEGNSDSLKTKNFTINQTLGLESTLILKPQLSFSINVKPQNINIREITKYFIDKTLQNQLKGNLVVKELSFDQNRSDMIKGEIELKDFKHPHTKALNIQSKIRGSFDKLIMEQLIVKDERSEVLFAHGNIEQNFKNININGTLQGNIEDILINDDIKAKILGQFEFSLNNHNPTLKANMSIQNAFFQNYYADHFYINFEQKEKEFILHQLTMNANPILSLYGSGSINYNFINDQYYNNKNSIILKIKGNPLFYLSKEFELLDSAKSTLDGYLSISMNEEGLLIKDGNLELENGKIKVKDQQEAIDKIRLSLSISNNRVKINDFQSRIGQGRLIIRNEILNNERDFILGNVNFGQLFLKTEGEGILIHIPYYSPKNSVSNVSLKGRYSDEALIYGPFDDIHIIGDIVFSNGSGIYPEDSENLQQYFNMWTSARKDQKKKQEEIIERKDIIEEDLPFTLDLKLYFKENMRYLTYPLNLLVNPDSYLELSYKNGYLGVNSAQFTSENGEIEIFGTIFKADYLSVIITPYEYNPIVIGTFYKKVYDGSTIFLEVSSDRSNPNFIESLTFKLRSDNSDDKTTAQILAKLRYGKSLDELSQQQEELILQDEALQLVGVSLGSAFLDPYLSPVESKIRKWMKLDNFSLNPGFIQNLFNEYKSDSHSKFKTEDKDVASFSSSILLNNLSINMGKYINNKLYLGYDGLFQEENDLFRNNRLLMYNNLSLRYDLPYKFKLMYEYQIIPHNKKDAHEIRLMRSFKF